MTSLVRAAGKLKAQKLTLWAPTTADVTADTNGTGVDTKEIEGDLWLYGMISHGTGAGSAVMRIEDSADDSSYAALNPGSGAIVTAACDATHGALLDVLVDRAKVRRYVRAVIDVTGTTAISAVAAVIGVAKNP